MRAMAKLDLVATAKSIDVAESEFPRTNVGQNPLSRYKYAFILIAAAALSLVAILSMSNFITDLSISNEENHGTVRNSIMFGNDDARGSAADSEQCLKMDLNQDMDSLVASARQIFVTMPDKGGGSSTIRFAAQCLGNQEKGTRIWEKNILNKPKEWKQAFVASLRVDPIIASHLSSDQGLIRLAKYPNRDTLIIHIHREESSRLASAVKHITTSRLCNVTQKEANMIARYRAQHKGQRVLPALVQKNNTHCILEEGGVVNKIEARWREVGDASHDILTCRSYKALQENAPQIVFLHYKQLDKLQTLLATHHCPEMLDDLPVKRNVASEKPLQVLLQRGGSKGVVSIEEWLRAKGPALEWALGLRRDASCQAKTVHMEDDLFGCPDEALRVTPEIIAEW